MLDLRTSFKEDIKATASELVYGTTLRLPAEYFLDEEREADPQIFIERFRQQMREVRATPTAHHTKRKAFTHKTLYDCMHVFVRVNKVKGPLEAPYEGPFEVIERLSDRLFKVRTIGGTTNISVERLKPAFTETQATDTPSQ